MLKERPVFLGKGRCVESEVLPGGHQGMRI